MEKYKNKLFKLLPLYEGKQIGTDLFLPADVAFEQYETHLDMEIIEFSGIDSEPFNEVLHYLKGLKSIGREVTHKQVRSVVLHCVALLGE